MFDDSDRKLRGRLSIRSTRLLQLLHDFRFANHVCESLCGPGFFSRGCGSELLGQGSHAVYSLTYSFRSTAASSYALIMALEPYLTESFLIGIHRSVVKHTCQDGLSNFQLTIPGAKLIPTPLGGVDGSLHSKDDEICLRSQIPPSAVPNGNRRFVGRFDFTPSLILYTDRDISYPRLCSLSLFRLDNPAGRLNGFRGVTLLWDHCRHQQDGQSRHHWYLGQPCPTAGGRREERGS